MTGGHNKTSDAQKRAAATWRPSTSEEARRNATPVLQQRAPSPPGDLPKAAQAIWRKWAPKLARIAPLTETDRDGLAMWCMLVVRMRAYIARGETPPLALSREQRLWQAHFSKPRPAALPKANTRSARSASPCTAAEEAAARAQFSELNRNLKELTCPTKK